jgi:hypothetical protein
MCIFAGWGSFFTLDLGGLDSKLVLMDQPIGKTHCEYLMAFWPSILYALLTIVVLIV